MLIEGDGSLMKGIVSESVDVIITSPPFNIGTEYGNNYNDRQPWKRYFDSMRRFLESSYRVLKKDGQLVVQLADVIGRGRKVIALAQWFDNTLAQVGFRRMRLVVVVPVTTSGALSGGDHRWRDSVWGGVKGMHSPATHLIIAKKQEVDSACHAIQCNGDIWFENADAKSCDWIWSEAFGTRLVQEFTEIGDSVLDPFAGTGSLGRVCKQLGRKYIGFEQATTPAL